VKEDLMTSCGKVFLSGGRKLACVARLSILMALLVAAALPSTGHAATASIGGRELERIVLYDAAPGELNQVEMTAANGAVTIRDSGAVIVADPGCTLLDDHEVRCSAGTTFAVLSLGDRRDTATILQGGAIVLGGAGNDVVTACSSCRLPELAGGPGSDVLTGSNRGDFISGGGGDDTVLGRRGGDLIAPGAGDDTVDAGGGSRDFVGFNRARRTGVVVNLRTGEARGQGEDTIVGAENVSGTRFDDVLIGNGLDNWLGGAGGTDTLLGGRGADRLRGGGDDDVLVGGLGRDRLKGENGDDRLRARDGTPDLVRGGPGMDWARVDRRDDVRGIERLR
jgi:Ca2+-binding RTX toxin-like protein